MTPTNNESAAPETSETPETDALRDWKWIPGQDAFTQLEGHYKAMTNLACSLERRLRELSARPAPVGMTESERLAWERLEFHAREANEFPDREGWSVDAEIVCAALRRLSSPAPLAGLEDLKRYETRYESANTELWDCDEKRLVTMPSATKMVRFEDVARLSSPAGGWQPMETAPRDGTRFLIALDVCGTGEIKVWDCVANEKEHQGFEGIEPDDILLGWMPTPQWQPPVTPQGAEG
jgi:hypothetical protein